LKCVGERKVIDFIYDSEDEAIIHEEYMKSKGWFVYTGTHNLFLGDSPLRKSYAKEIPQGAFL